VKIKGKILGKFPLTSSYIKKVNANFINNPATHFMKIRIDLQKDWRFVIKI